MTCRPRLFSVIHPNGAVRLIIYVDVLASNGNSFSRNHYYLPNPHCLTLFEADVIYGVADPCISDGIIILATSRLVRHPIVDVP
jgi:hypothetical protein